MIFTITVGEDTYDVNMNDYPKCSLNTRELLEKHANWWWSNRLKGWFYGVRSTWNAVEYALRED